MELHHGLAGLAEIPPGGVVSIGNYDGMHLGHARLLEMARSLREKSRSGRIAVATFEPHPLTVLRPELAPPRLTPPAIKQALLAAAGVDDYVILPPAPEVLNLTAEKFWSVLADDIRPSHLIEGDRFTFGKGRGGTIERLWDWCLQTRSGPNPIELHVVNPVTAVLLDMTLVPVSSSLIRWLLAQGRVRDAAICLGRPYALRCEVIKGFGRGKQLGVPTANLGCADQLIPADGVYAGRCTINGQTHAAAVSIGSLPTFDQRQFQVEAHLIGFDGDLYGRTIEVEVVDWIREQWKFAGVEPLKQQIARDLETVSERAGADAARPIAAA
jgi:riboflavin kinase/FMN adenylyltransferase